VALGKMSLIVPKHKFEPYLRQIFASIAQEIEAAKPKVSPSKGPPHVPAQEVLTCVKLLLKFYGEEFKSFFEMVTFVNDLFFFGFTKQLIETLTELGKICKAEYKGIT
jgi:hypothetical protein